MSSQPPPAICYRCGSHPVAGVCVWCKRLYCLEHSSMFPYGMCARHGRQVRLISFSITALLFLATILGTLLFGRF